jgi:hypothetical protein
VSKVAESHADKPIDMPVMAGLPFNDCPQTNDCHALRVFGKMIRNEGKFISTRNPNDADVIFMNIVLPKFGNRTIKETLGNRFIESGNDNGNIPA